MRSLRRFARASHFRKEPKLADTTTRHDEDKCDLDNLDLMRFSLISNGFGCHSESRFGDGSIPFQFIFEVEVGAGRAAPRPGTGEYQRANQGKFLRNV